MEDRALIMELVDGVTLAERIARGPVPAEEARAIIDQLIDALAYAHEKGVIHRDLKPANIKLTPEGRVKILDFGLAKAVSEDNATADPTSSPTLTMRATLAGVIMGTAGYMAPEQARGHAVDERADIWSFGVVVYEMLTGRQLFVGPTVSDTLASVLKESPDFDAAPPEMRSLLRHCLEKEPQRRMRAIADVRILITEAPAAVVPDARVRSRRLALLWGGLLAAAAVVGLLAVRPWQGARPASRRLVWLNVDLGADAVAARDLTVAISPDGSHIAFPVATAGLNRLAIRDLSQPNAAILPGTDGGVNPFFSPDGKWIAFGAGGKLKKVSIQGGPPVILCDGGLRGGSWGEDGYIVAALGNEVGLSRVREEGGTPQMITTPENGEVTHRWPQVLPGGEAVIFSANAGESDWEQATVQLLSSKTGQRRVLQRGAFYGRYARSGHLIFLRGNILYGQPFDLDRLELKGAPEALIDGVATSSFGGGQLDFTADGTAVFLSGRTTDLTVRPLMWVGANGKTEAFFAPPPGRVSMPMLSPDGNRLALTIGGGDLWVYDLKRQVPTRLAAAGRAFGVIWAPDSQHLVYGSPTGPQSGLMWIVPMAAESPSG